MYTETGKRDLLSQAVPCTNNPTPLHHKMRQKVLVLFPVTLIELVQGGDAFHGWHSGKSWVNIGTRKSTWVRFWEGSRLWKLKLSWVPGNKEGEVLRYKRQEDSGKTEIEVTCYGKDETKQREKGLKQKREKRGNASKCLPCQGAGVGVWEQIPTNTERTRNKECKEKKKTSVLTW